MHVWIRNAVHHRRHWALYIGICWWTHLIFSDIWPSVYRHWPVDLHLQDVCIAAGSFQHFREQETGASLENCRISDATRNNWFGARTPWIIRWIYDEYEPKNHLIYDEFMMNTGQQNMPGWMNQHKCYHHELIALLMQLSFRLKIGTCICLFFTKLILLPYVTYTTKQCFPSFVWF